MPTPLERLGARVKSFAMRFPSRSRTASSFLVPQTHFDYAKEVGDGRGSALLMAIGLWTARTFPEAPLKVRQNDAQEETHKIIPNHPLSRLMERPNPAYSGIALWMATMIDFTLDGNAYWLKVRSKTDAVVQLWYCPSWMIEPVYPENSSDTFISHYLYKPDTLGPERGIKIPVEEVVHLRYGIDNKNTRKGLSPYKSLLREVFTDDEAASFTAALVRNMGVPGVIISPADADAEASEDDLRDVKDAFMRRFGGDRRGEPLVMRNKTEVTVLSFSPQQMDLKGLRRLPEERVAAVFGLPAVVVGFGAGLDRSTFANFEEARRAAYEQLIAPLQRLIAADLTIQILPDFTINDLAECYFDWGEVRILQEDESRKSKRLTEQLTSGAMDLYQYRQLMGYDALPEHKGVWYVPKNVVMVKSDQLGDSTAGQPPKPVAAPSNGNGAAPAKELAVIARGGAS
jgi:HK97 family phage portal protein